jgi:hypothetical protein
MACARAQCDRAKPALAYLEAGKGEPARRPSSPARIACYRLRMGLLSPRRFSVT